MSEPGSSESRSPLAVLGLPMVWLILAYQATLGHLVGGRCRFHPTCSNYALEAFRTWDPLRASLLTLRRLLRCHPLGGSGIDPPPAYPPRRG